VWNINWGALKDGYTYETKISATITTGETATKTSEYTVEQASQTMFVTNKINYSRSGDTYSLSFNLPPKEIEVDFYKEGVLARIGTTIVLPKNTKNNETSFKFPLMLAEDSFYKITVRATDKNGNILLSSKDYIPTILDFKVFSQEIDLIDGTGIYSPNQAAFSVSLTKPAESITVELTDRRGEVFHTYSASDVQSIQFLPGAWGSKRLEYASTYYFKLHAVAYDGSEINTNKSFVTGKKPEVATPAPIKTTPVTKANGIVVKQQLTLEEMDERASSLISKNYEFNAQEVGETYSSTTQNQAYDTYILSLIHI